MTPATPKEWIAHAIALLLTAALIAIALLSVTGAVDLRDATTSLFVGSLVGLIAGLLSSPLVWYYGALPPSPKNGDPE